MTGNFKKTYSKDENMKLFTHIYYLPPCVVGKSTVKTQGVHYHISLGEKVGK